MVKLGWTEFIKTVERLKPSSSRDLADSLQDTKENINTRVNNLLTFRGDIKSKHKLGTIHTL
jgi:hypothetical protein